MSEEEERKTPLVVCATCRSSKNLITFLKVGVPHGASIADSVAKGEIMVLGHECRKCGHTSIMNAVTFRLRRTFVVDVEAVDEDAAWEEVRGWDLEEEWHEEETTCEEMVDNVAGEGTGIITRRDAGGGLSEKMAEVNKLDAQMEALKNLRDAIRTRSGAGIGAIIALTIANMRDRKADLLDKVGTKPIEQVRAERGL